MIIPVLVAVIVAALLLVILMTLSSRKKNPGSKSKKVSEAVQKKGKSALIKETEKKLARDPRNIAALELLGELYYKDSNWEKTYNIYKTLSDLSTAHVEINQAKADGRLGTAAYNLEKYSEAETALISSVKKEPEQFATNYYLAKTFLHNNVLDKAIYFLKKCRIIQPDNREVISLIGTAFFKAQKYRESLPYLKQAVEDNPDNKENLFYLAMALSDSGMGDKALKFFIHLRPHPVYGPQSCIEAGRIHEKNKDLQSAVQDYEIGLRHTGTEEKILLQLKYRLALAYIGLNNIPAGLNQLSEISAIHSGYKDVEALIVRYRELNQNKNLQTYMLSGTSDFVTLCRKLISVIFKDAFVKVEDIQVSQDRVEIVCDIESNKWQAKELFDFYRTTTDLSDITVREFHSKMRDSKCEGGYCVTMGNFSESAHRFIEGRPIDLIEKTELSKMLKKVNMIG